MKLRKFRKCAWSLALGCALLAVTAYAQTAGATAQEEDAGTQKGSSSGYHTRAGAQGDLLRATSDRLAAAKTLSFTAVELFETSSRHGHPLAYTMRYQVTQQRPDKLKVIIPGDGPASEFYYDGKTMTAFAPSENLIAVATARSTIDATLEAAYHSAGNYYPFTDMIVADPYKDMAPGLELAYCIGQSHEVGMTTTDMVAYINNGVFMQIWIGADDKLPRLIRAVFLNDPEHFPHEVGFTNWQLDTAVSADAFAPANAAGAKKIEFAHPHPQPQR